MTTDPGPAPLSDAEYRTLSDAVLAAVETRVDAWLEADVIDIDAHRTGGLLEMRFPNGSVLVLNTQPPLQELWLAARSGGFHYKYVDGAWRDTRSGVEFWDRLSTCATEQGAQPLRFTPP